MTMATPWRRIGRQNFLLHVLIVAFVLCLKVTLSPVEAFSIHTSSSSRRTSKLVHRMPLFARKKEKGSAKGFGKPVASIPVIVDDEEASLSEEGIVAASTDGTETVKEKKEVETSDTAEVTEQHMYICMCVYVYIYRYGVPHFHFPFLLFSLCTL